MIGLKGDYFFVRLLRSVGSEAALSVDVIVEGGEFNVIRVQ